MLLFCVAARLYASMIALPEDNNIWICDKMFIRVVNHQMAVIECLDCSKCVHSVPTSVDRFDRLGRGTQHRECGSLCGYMILEN